MDVDALRDSPVGQLVPISGADARFGDYSYWAYLPDRLPECPELLPATWNAISDASRALGRLHQACAQLRNPELLIRPTLVREAMDTSALEGTFGELPEVLEARISDAPQTFSAETREIRAYEAMANHGFELIRDGRPLSVSMLTDLQAILAEGSRFPVRDPGIVREHQVFVGPENATRIEEARYVPPPPDDRLRAGLNDWETWVTETPDLPAPLMVAMAHYQFEALHPFGDGNGRVGRLAAVLQMLQDDTISHPALTVSHWLLRRREQYQRELFAVSATGDWNPWVTFFCQAVCEQSERSVVASVALLDWLSEIRGMLGERHYSGVISALAEDLFEWPVITMPFTAKKYEVSVPTAKSAIDRLVALGIIQEMTGRSYRRVFGAMRIIEIVETM